MSKTERNTIYRISAWILLFFTVISIRAEYGDVLDRKIRLSKNKGAVYELLKEVSDASGYLFIYDSQSIDNDKKVKIKKEEYTIRTAIYAITGKNDLRIDVLGNHILLRLPDIHSNKKAIVTSSEEDEILHQKEDYFTFGGTLYDRITNEPVIYGTIGVDNSSIGTVSNQDGEFQLVIPDSLNSSLIRFSHIGYSSQVIEASLLAGQNVRLYLEPKIVPLQEIVVRVIDPVEAINKMIRSKDINYSSQPVYLTTFYREGINFKHKNVDLTESVLKVYKTGYRNTPNSDQVKLMKMRRIQNKQEADTVLSKMRSGVNSCLFLDIMKNFPDFLGPQKEILYAFTHTDINVIDNRRVNVISFEQKKHNAEPLYKGQLLIEAENSALVEARFEVNPDYVEKATSFFVEKKSSDLKLTLQRASYIVSYKLSEDGTYRIGHIRGDINFKVRKKKRLFSSPLHFWFEMVNCKTETRNVKSFPRNERLSTNKVFSETKFEYDKNFWGNLNVILPEDKLKELIVNNLNEIITESP